MGDRALRARDPAALLGALQADASWHRSIAALRDVDEPALLLGIAACPHLEKRKRADVVGRATISLEALQYAIEQLTAMLDGDLTGQIERRNPGFFMDIADHALACVVLGRVARATAEIRPLLALASRAWLVGERISETPPFGDRHHAIAAAVLADCEVDLYRTLMPTVRKRFSPTLRAVCEGLLGLADAASLEDTISRTPEPDDAIYAMGHRSALQTLDALVRGDVNVAARSASHIGNGYLPLATHKAKGSVDPQQFADLLGSAVVALVTRAGGQVPAHPYVLVV